MLNTKIQKAIEEFNNSPIAKYYSEKGQKRAQQSALSSARMKYIMPKILEEKSETKISKEKIIEAHSKCKTWNDVLEYLGIWHGTYSRLCKKFGISELKYDKTTKNNGPSKSIIVFQLTEKKAEKYSSRKEAIRNLFLNGKTGLRIRNDKLNYEKKIDYQTDKNNRKIRAKFTGKTSQIGNRTPSQEIQIFELVEKYIGTFPSREEVYRTLGEVAIQSQLNGKIYQSKGYRFYEKN